MPTMPNVRPRNRGSGATCVYDHGPPRAPEAAVQEVNAPGQRKRHAERGVGNIFGPVVGNIGDFDTAPAGRGAIHIVEADPAPHDEPAVLQRMDCGFADPKAVIHHDCVRIVDPSNEFRLMASVECDDIREIAQNTTLAVERLGNEICDDDLESCFHKLNAATAD